MPVRTYGKVILICCWWDCKWTAIKEVSMGVPQKLKIEVLYNPAISLGVYLKDSKSPYHRYLDIHFYCGTIHNS